MCKIDNKHKTNFSEISLNKLPNFLYLDLSKDILLNTHLWFVFNISTLIFSLVLYFPGYAGEDKDETQEEEDEQGDETASI